MLAGGRIGNELAEMEEAAVQRVALGGAVEALASAVRPRVGEEVSRACGLAVGDGRIRINPAGAAGLERDLTERGASVAAHAAAEGPGRGAVTDRVGERRASRVVLP